MAEIEIPHAISTFVETDPPRKILHVVTALPENFGATGFDAGAKQDMLVSVAKIVATHGLDHYVVHWSASPIPAKKSRRPADVAANAVHVMKILTGEIEEDVEQPSVAAELGRRGGQARAMSMTPERRAEIARNAAKARYSKRD